LQIRVIYARIEYMQQKIKMFALQDLGEGHVTLLGEFNNWEDIKICPRDFDKDVVVEFEVYYLGEEE